MFGQQMEHAHHQYIRDILISLVIIVSCYLLCVVTVAPNVNMSWQLCCFKANSHYLFRYIFVNLQTAVLILCISANRGAHFNNKELSGSLFKLRQL